MQCNNGISKGRPLTTQPLRVDLRHHQASHSPSAQGERDNVAKDANKSYCACTCIGCDQPKNSIREEHRSWRCCPRGLAPRLKVCVLQQNGLTVCSWRMTANPPGELARAAMLLPAARASMATALSEDAKANTSTWSWPHPTLCC